MTKSNLEGLGLFHFSAYGPTLGKPKQEPEGRNWNRDQRGVLLPGLFQAHIQLPLLDILVNLPSGSTASSEMGLPTSFSNQENTPTDLPIGQLDESSSSVEIPSLLRTKISCGRWKFLACQSCSQSVPTKHTEALPHSEWSTINKNRTFFTELKVGKRKWILQYPGDRRHHQNNNMNHITWFWTHNCFWELL